MHLAKQIVLSLEFSTQHRKQLVLEKRIKELEHDKESLQSDFEAAQGSVDLMRDMVEKSRKEYLSQVEETIKTEILMGQAVNALDSEVVELRSKVINLEAETSFLRQLNSQLAGDLKSTKEEATKGGRKLEKAVDELSAIKVELAKAKGKLGEAASSIASLTIEKNALETSKQKLEADNAELMNVGADALADDSMTGKDRRLALLELAKRRGTKGTGSSSSTTEPIAAPPLSVAPAEGPELGKKRKRLVKASTSLAAAATVASTEEESSGSPLIHRQRKKPQLRGLRLSSLERSRPAVASNFSTAIFPPAGPSPGPPAHPAGGPPPPLPIPTATAEGGVSSSRPSTSGANHENFSRVITLVRQLISNRELVEWNGDEVDMHWPSR
ncbi:uncharacterized protein [Phaseolus vulgaris]|uniref:uncharacterized protein n=1 Tax=Phaseolus vulgaris TaxID=3885 RepID=UPI0035C98EC0